MHHQWSPDELQVEAALPEAVRTALAARGHQLRVQNGLAVSQLVARPDGKVFIGVADPRAGGQAAGW
jgi:gamma-glutamyltranspeptidase